MKKQFRVKKSSDIEAILKKRKMTRNAHFSIFIDKNHECTHFRYAISVPKKYGNAVMRNKIKRQIRMIIKDMPVKGHTDLFIIVYPKANTLDFSSIKKHLYQLSNRLNILEVKT